MRTIACIGSITADILVSGFADLPAPGTLTSFPALAVEVGGCAANVALDLAKLGGQPRLICKIGEDMWGQVIARRLSAELPRGLMDVVRDKTVDTTVSIVLINQQGERSFLYHPGSTSAFTLSDVSPTAIQESDIIFIAGAMLLTSFDGEDCATLLRDCQAAGKYTAMDTAWDFQNIWMPKILPSLPYLDLFMPSYEEAVKLTGEGQPSRIAQVLKNHGVKNVVIKLGSKGALLSPQNGEELLIPAFSGMHVVDTTGAGDAFCAGFLYGLSSSWSFEQCAIFANATAAHCVTAIGASTGIPAASDITTFIQRKDVVLDQ